MRLVALILILIAVTAMNGCILVGFGGDPKQVVVPTIGQQLIDLKRAYDDGAITKPEYDRAKAKLMSEMPGGNGQNSEPATHGPTASTDSARLRVG